MAIITVSQGAFSGARELARRLSQELVYRLAYREDVIEKTSQYGMSPARLERARRRHLGMWPQMDLGWTHYLVFVRAALSKEIRDCSLIYLGDNGRALLRDFPNVLDVRVVADMERRIANLMERTDYVINKRKAKRLIERIDEKKVRWRRTIHDDGRHDQSEFNLMIELGQTSISEACQLIRDAVERPQYQTTPKSMDTVELLTVAAELRARIAMKSEVADDNVGVEVNDGVITVTGSVHSTADLDAIKTLLY